MKTQKTKGAKRNSQRRFAEARGSANPISLNAAQITAIKEWAADDRLWTTELTVRLNLETFARVILKADSPNAPHELPQREQP